MARPGRESRRWDGRRGEGGRAAPVAPGPLRTTAARKTLVDEVKGVRRPCGAANPGCAPRSRPHRRRTPAPPSAPAGRWWRQTSCPGEADVAIEPAEAERLDVLSDREPAEHGALDGRGLQIVGLLADRWGTADAPIGKTVWFETRGLLHRVQPTAILGSQARLQAQACLRVERARPRSYEEPSIAALYSQTGLRKQERLLVPVESGWATASRAASGTPAQPLRYSASARDLEDA